MMYFLSQNFQVQILYTFLFLRIHEICVFVHIPAILIVLLFFLGTLTLSIEYCIFDTFGFWDLYNRNNIYKHHNQWEIVNFDNFLRHMKNEY